MPPLAEAEGLVCIMALLISEARLMAETPCGPLDEFTRLDNSPAVAK